MEASSISLMMTVIACISKSKHSIFVQGYGPISSFHNGANHPWRKPTAVDSSQRLYCFSLLRAAICWVDSAFDVEIKIKSIDLSLKLFLNKINFCYKQDSRLRGTWGVLLTHLPSNSQIRCALSTSLVSSTATYYSTLLMLMILD